MVDCNFSYRDGNGAGWDLPGQVARETLNRLVRRGFARWYCGRWEIVLD